MLRKLRVRMVTAALLAALLLATAASPLLSEVPGWGGAAHAEHCGGSSC